MSSHKNIFKWVTSLSSLHLVAKILWFLWNVFKRIFPKWQRCINRLLKNCCPINLIWIQFLLQFSSFGFSLRCNIVPFSPNIEWIRMKNISVETFRRIQRQQPESYIPTKEIKFTILTNTSIRKDSYSNLWKLQRSIMDQWENFAFH